MADQQRLITSCGSEVRKLAGTERRLESTLFELVFSMSGLDDFTGREDETQWSNVTERSRQVRENSQQGAAKLAAAIEVYLTVHGAATEENIAGMIIELTALLGNLDSLQFDQCATALGTVIDSASELASDIRRVVQQESAALSENIKAMDAEHTTLRRQMLQLPEKDVTPQERATLDRATTPGNAAGPAKVTPEDFKDKHAVLEKIRTIEGALRTAQRRLRVLRWAEWDDVADRMGAVVEDLKKEKEQMRALPEVKKLLLHEVTAYFSAFDSLKTFPGPDRKAMLKKMQDRVTETASAWRDLAELLTNEYAKGRAS